MENRQPKWDALKDTLDKKSYGRVLSLSMHASDFSLLLVRQLAWLVEIPYGWKWFPLESHGDFPVQYLKKTPEVWQAQRRLLRQQQPLHSDPSADVRDLLGTEPPASQGHA